MSELRWSAVGPAGSPGTLFWRDVYPGSSPIAEVIRGGHFGFDEKRRKKRFDDDREDEERRK